jgi:hypothetical protein
MCNLTWTITTLFLWSCNDGVVWNSDNQQEPTRRDGSASRRRQLRRLFDGKLPWVALQMSQLLRLRLVPGTRRQLTCFLLLKYRKRIFSQLFHLDVVLFFY